MRPLAALLFVAVALAACRPSGQPPIASETPTVTVEATATPDAPPIDILPARTPTPPPTPTPLPPAPASGLWVLDLARGKLATLHEGAATAAGYAEASGSAVSATITDETGSTAIRFRPAGDPIEEYAGRGLIVTSDSGESRFYLDTSDPEASGLALEHQGEVVPLEGTRPRAGMAYSPAGDRLLAVSERPGLVGGEVVRTFSVHSVTDGRLRMQFEHRVLAGAPELVHWSPSSRYVADESLDGIFVRDTITGRAWRLGPRGSARWSPTADQLLVVTDLDRLSIVNIPDLDGIDLGPIDGPATVLFDRSGELAVVTTYRERDSRDDPTTRAFEVRSGTEVATWPGMDASRFAIGGIDPVIAINAGIVAVFEDQTGCDGGFVAYHPAFSADGRCIRGANPRWSPDAQLLVYARDREVVLLSVSSDVERVIARGTPPADLDGGPLIDWSPEGSWVLIQWPSSVAGGDSLR